MNLGSLRGLLRAQPFKPFAIHMADGRKLVVHHPELLAASPVGRTAVLFSPREDTFEIINMTLITSVKPVADKNGHRSQSSKGG